METMRYGRESQISSELGDIKKKKKKRGTRWNGNLDGWEKNVPVLHRGHSNKGGRQAGTRNVTMK
jgi:hypothetical protein